MKNEHDDRYTHADRADIYEKLERNPISTLASPDQCARVPLKGMPQPTGKVYRGEETEKKLEDIIKISMINENDFKIDIMEDFIHSSEYTNILTNFYHNHFHIITQSKLPYMHYFPLDTYITANGLRKLEFGQKCKFIKQQLHVLGDLNDRIIIAQNEDYAFITNRQVGSDSWFYGFNIKLDKSSNELLFSYLDKDTYECNIYNTLNKENNNKVESSIKLLIKCFEKLYLTSNIKEYINLEEFEEKIFSRLSVEQHGELANLIVDMIKQNGGLHLNLDQVLAQYCRSDFKDNTLMSDADDIENRNKEMDEKAQTLVKRKYI